MRKCASRSAQVPATPSCSVQFSAETPGRGWRASGAEVPPKNVRPAESGLRAPCVLSKKPVGTAAWAPAEVTESGILLLSQACATVLPLQSVNRLTLYALEVTASKSARTEPHGSCSQT